MFVDDDGRAPAVAQFRLDAAVADMYADLRTGVLLHRLLAHSRVLLHTVAGSISLVDAAAGRYRKIAEDGVACQLGRSFPLHEGATGTAVARRRPVVIDDYRAVRSGHLPRDHPAGRGAAAAVPLWWRGEVVGVNVAFAGCARRFTAAEVDAFELLTQSVAAAVVGAATAGPSAVAGPRRRVGTDGPGPVAATPPPGAAPLTPREGQVLALMADGLSDRELATRLGISPRTVEKHVGAVLRKTGRSSRTAAVVHALDRGWLGSDRPGGARVSGR